MSFRVKTLTCFVLKHVYVLLNCKLIFLYTVLQLEKAETYEERRLIRGQMRLAKRPSTTPGTTSSPATYKRFVDMTPSKPSPTASPQTTRRFDRKPEEPKKGPESGDKKHKPISKCKCDSCLALIYFIHHRELGFGVIFFFEI